MAKEEESFALRDIFRLFEGDSTDIWSIVLYSVGIGFLSLAVPVAIQSLVNTVATGALLQPLIVLTVGLALVLLLSGLMRVLQLSVAEQIQRRLVVRIGLLLAARIPRIDFDYLRKKFGREYINRFLEVFHIQKSATLLLIDGSQLFFQVLFGLLLLAFYHPFLMVFSLLLFLSISFILYPLGIGGVRTSIQESNAKYSALAWLEDLAGAPNTFKNVLVGQNYALGRMDQEILRYLSARSAHFRVILRQKIGALLLQALGLSLLLGVGGLLVIQGELTLGQLVAAELVLGYVLLGVTKFIKQLEAFYDLAASVKKVGHLLDSPVEIERGRPTEHPPGPARLQFEKLSLRSRGRDLLKDATLEFSPGSRTAIYGENGCGKSALMGLLFGLRRPDAGLISLDGRVLRDMSLDTLRSEVTLIRGLEILHGTIEENLLCGRENVSISELRQVLSLVGLESEVRDLPDGLNTFLQGQPYPLSKGQGYRLMIARALLARPRLLLLDETLDGVDDRDVGRLIDVLSSKDLPSTVIVTTHDRQMLKRFDQAWIMEGGAIHPYREIE